MLVNQYNENGSMLVSKLTERRGCERATAQINLSQKKKEILKVYAVAKNCLRENAGNKENETVSDFETQWKMQQEASRKKISEGLAPKKH